MADYFRRQLALTKLANITAKYATSGEQRRADGTVRHKCFISYHKEDAEEALAFVESFESVFIPKSVGISVDDPLIDSDDNDYVMNRIRDKYLADSTVTILLVGRCTWARKFVDWELYSSLRRDPKNRLNGLLAIELQSIAGRGVSLPARAKLNMRSNSNPEPYGRYIKYPSSRSDLQGWIDDAFAARSTRAKLIKLGGPRKTSNSACS
jgi:hypothetical protein